MNEPMTDFEVGLADALRAHVDRPELLAPPAAVVTDVTGRPRGRPFARRRLAAATGVAVLALVSVVVATVGPRLFDNAASNPSMARVRGVDYFVGLGSALVVSEADLLRFDAISWASDEGQFADRIAYRLAGVDPNEALVARAAPGRFPDTPVDFLVLRGRLLVGPDRRPASAALCSYFDLDHPAMRESDCRDLSSPQPPDLATNTSPAPSLAAASPLRTPTPTADLVGQFVGSRQLEGGCAWVRDESTGSPWEVIWPDGYRVEFEGDAPLLLSPAGEVVARSGDRMGLRGTEGWYAEGELIIKFNVAVVDPVAAERGSEIPREAVRSEWALAHELEEIEGPLFGSFLFRITDGTSEQAKIAELERLDEVKTATRNPLGSFCMVGLPFTATEIEFIDPIVVPTEAELPPAMVLPDRTLRAVGFQVDLTDVRSSVLRDEKGWLPLDGATIALASDPHTGRAQVWIASLEDGVEHLIHPAGVLEDADPGRGWLLVRTRGGFDLIDRDGRLIATLPITDATDAVLLADGTVAVTGPEEIGVWDPVTGSVSWARLPEGLEEASLIAVGTNVVAWTYTYDNVLLDPRTATAIGDRWRAGSYAVAASPNGRLFVAHVYVPTGHVGRLELRDGVTGETLVVDSGTEMTTIDSIAWLNEDLMLVMRKPLPTYEVSVPPAWAELRTLSDFATRVEVAPLAPNQSGVLQRGPFIAVFGLSGEVVLMTSRDSAE